MYSRYVVLLNLKIYLHYENTAILITVTFCTYIVLETIILEHVISDIIVTGLQRKCCRGSATEFFLNFASGAVLFSVATNIFLVVIRPFMFHVIMGERELSFVLFPPFVQNVSVRFFGYCDFKTTSFWSNMHK